jgi:hypothetical protein
MVEEPRALWDQEPEFLTWTIKTWEHAALVPNSFGLSARVRDSKRLLPHEFTAPIYAALAEAESNILRNTEPLPPYEARLLRETNPSMFLDSIRQGKLFKYDEIFGKRLSDLVPDWDSIVELAVRPRVDFVKENLQTYATLGIPQETFLVSYGYSVKYTVLKGMDVDNRIDTHRSLLINCHENIFQPGFMRNITDALRD